MSCRDEQAKASTNIKWLHLALVGYNKGTPPEEAFKDVSCSYVSCDMCPVYKINNSIRSEICGIVLNN